MSRIDVFFYNEDWDTNHDDHILHALSSSLSDHCPLLLVCCQGPKNQVPFVLRSFGFICQGSPRLQKKLGSNLPYIPIHITSSKISSNSLGSTKNNGARVFYRMQRFNFTWLFLLSSILTCPWNIGFLLRRKAISMLGLNEELLDWRSLIGSGRSKERVLIILRDGDANTKIFHKRVNSRRRKTSS
jgi:hypothetical protein